MEKILLWAAFLLFPASICAQDSIYVKATYDKAASYNQFTVEIVNKRNKSLHVSNITPSNYLSYIEIFWYDKNGKQIAEKYLPATFGIPFINNREGVKRFFEIAPKSSITFTFSEESLLSYFCTEPERVKKMKFKFHIKYSDDESPKTYEQYSEMFTL